MKAPRSILRAAVVVLVLNGLFLLLVVLAVPDESPATRARVRAAFHTGDLAHEDYLLFDSRRGFFQYNDCNVLQMIANAGSSRLERAISPVVYSANDDWTDQCAVLDRVIAQDSAVDGLIENRYSRYWHGYNAGVATALRWMELRTLRRTLVAAVWLSLAALTLLMFRSGAGSRRIGGGIALAAGAFWAVPYFDPGFTFGFGDAALLLGLAVLAARPRVALDFDTLVPFAAGFGAVIVFFEMLTGQLPVAAAWLVAGVAAARHDHARDARGGMLMPAFAALAAFAVGGLATVAIKQVLALTLADPDAGRAFMSHLDLYVDVPDRAGRRPGILLPFIRLWDRASLLTYGSHRAGHALVSLIAVAWLAGAARAWHERAHAPDAARIVLLAAALAPLAWVLLLPQHTYLHATFMVRILVASIALAPVAALWPAPRDAGARLRTPRARGGIPSAQPLSRS